MRRRGALLAVAGIGAIPASGAPRYKRVPTEEAEWNAFVLACNKYAALRNAGGIGLREWGKVEDAWDAMTGGRECRSR